MKKIFALLLALVIGFSPVVWADGYDLANKQISELASKTVISSGDKIPVYDATTGDVQTVAANAPVFSGDVTFRTSILANGRVNAASSAASSSTNLAPSSLPYSVFRKYVGGNNSLDETNGGTRLPNGIPGQTIVFIIADIDTNGSWIITPVTSTIIDNVVMDTKADTVTMLYMNDTIGWVVTAQTGCTVTYVAQTGIPNKP